MYSKWRVILRTVIESIWQHSSRHWPLRMDVKGGTWAWSALEVPEPGLGYLIQWPGVNSLVSGMRGIWKSLDQTQEAASEGGDIRGLGMVAFTNQEGSNALFNNKAYHRNISPRSAPSLVSGWSRPEVPNLTGTRDQIHRRLSFPCVT